MSTKGQSLLELVIVIAVAIIVISALTSATISSLRNANFSKNQLQATKFAQEGLEKVRSIRERNGLVLANFGTATTKFSDLWNIRLFDTCLPPPCNVNFLLDPVFNSLKQDDTAFETLTGDFQRSVKITDEPATYQTKKNITIIVSWIDVTGSHQSKLTTYLRKI